MTGANAPLVGKKHTPLFKQRGFRLFLMISPFIVLVFLLNYVPLYFWSYSFFNYKPGIPVTMERFVGLSNFTRIISDKYMLEEIVQVMRNTFGISLLSILTLPLPMFFAIFLSELKCTPFRKLVQTLTTIPNFISWVLVYAVAYAMFSVGDGFVNRLLVQSGLISQEINFLASRDHVWLTMMGYYIWKSLGWNSIMYFAAMSNIDPELTEAARVDGAGRWGCIWHITIPSLLPTLFVLFVLNVSNFVNYGMEQFYVFQNAMNKEFIQVLDLYVYNQGIQGVNYSYSIAIGILKSVVSLVLLFLANGLSIAVRKESVI